MNFKYSFCIMGLSAVLISCGGVPEADPVNCSGRGMEQALMAFKNNETERQAFIDKCDSLGKEK